MQLVHRSLLFCSHASISLPPTPSSLLFFVLKTPGCLSPSPQSGPYWLHRGPLPRACPETWQLGLRPAQIQVPFSSHDRVLTLRADFGPPPDPWSVFVRGVAVVEPLESLAAAAGALTHSSYPCGVGRVSQSHRGSRGGLLRKAGSPLSASCATLPARIPGDKDRLLQKEAERESLLGAAVSIPELAGPASRGQPPLEVS